MIFKKLSTNLRVRYFYSFIIMTISIYGIQWQWLMKKNLLKSYAMMMKPRTNPWKLLLANQFILTTDSTIYLLAIMSGLGVKYI